MGTTDKKMIYSTFIMPLTRYKLHEMEVENIEQVHEIAKDLLDEFQIDSIECSTKNYNCTINRPKNG